jgi:hypothetical protein
MKKKATKSQGGGTDQEGGDPDRNITPRINLQNKKYEGRRAAERERYRLRRKAYEERDGAAVLWETAVTAVVQAYRDAGGDSKIKEDELRHRLCWFRQLLLDEIEQPRNLKRVRQRREAEWEARRTQHRRVVLAAADAARLRIEVQVQTEAKINQPTYSSNEYPSQEPRVARPTNCASRLDAAHHGEAATTADKDQAGECTPTRVPVGTKAAEEEETIEEMVRRMERELDEEFSHLFPATVATAMPTASAPAATEAEAMVVTAAAATAKPTALPSGESPKEPTGSPMGTPSTMLPPEVPPAEPPDLMTEREARTLEDVVEEQPEGGQKPDTNNEHRTMGLTTRRLSIGETTQRAPYIEPAVRPPPDRDRYRRWYGCDLKGCEAHQLKGCRRRRIYQKVSAKGVLDTKYLCPRPRVRGRIPIHVWYPLTGTQRARLHGRSAFGRPAQ